MNEITKKNCTRPSGCGIKEGGGHEKGVISRQFLLEFFLSTKSICLDTSVKNARERGVQKRGGGGVARFFKIGLCTRMPLFSKHTG